MKIAIAGYGLEGKANYSYWNQPGNELTIVDERQAIDDLPDGVSTILGAGAFSKLQGFDMVVRTASLPPRNITTDGKVWSATNEFFAKCPAPIIGVTGTKGKGTTCSLIASILRAAGKTVHLVGNIGTPALGLLTEIKSDDIVVYELSSFQLWDAQKSPHVAVVLGIEPDHLDVHSDMDDYINAKANIRRFQSIADECIYHPTNEYARRIAGTELVNEPWNDEYRPLGIDFAHRYAVDFDNEAYEQDGYFCVQDRRICSIEHLRLPGRHNIENACAAISAITELADWPKRITDEHVVKGLEVFTGLPHRLNFVREANGVKYYDDSIATTPGSALAAIESFDEPKILLLGGHEKGSEYGELIKKCAEKDVHVIAYGANRFTLKKLCEESGVRCDMNEGDMSSITAAAAALARPGDVVILSPAAASYDMFKNYADRGDQFIAAVEQLSNE